MVRSKHIPISITKGISTIKKVIDGDLNPHSARLGLGPLPSIQSRPSPVSKHDKGGNTQSFECVLSLKLSDIQGIQSKTLVDDDLKAQVEIFLINRKTRWGKVQE